VALCSDLGIKPTHGAAMLSMLLAIAFFSRQMWGWISDRIGGLVTVLAGSLWQFFSVIALALTQDEIGLFTVTAIFGLGFSGIIPAYVLAVRELFPAHEAGWRVPILLCLTAFGMASGGWFAGLLYDHFGYYAPAFAAGLIFNFVNLILVGTLVARRGGWFGPRLAYG
jgi:MFS family permease